MGTLSVHKSAMVLENRMKRGADLSELSWLRGHYDNSVDFFGSHCESNEISGNVVAFLMFK